jgi:hypothetical protein
MNALLRPLFCLVSLGVTLIASADQTHEARLQKRYDVTRIPTPFGTDPQIGGMTTTRDGKIAVAFHRGNIAIYDPQHANWHHFAEGLHEPLGLEQDAQGNFIVMQRAELSRIRDTNGDKVADHYETFWDDFGLTGNYHEFAYGPVTAPDGRYIIGLNLASSGASIREEIRGRWSEIGMPRELFYAKNWKEVSVGAGKMWSRVPWRGWIMAIDPKTGEATPLADGFRSPDGLGFTKTGEVVVVDNQGDWRGTNEVHVLGDHTFHGHPATLIWRKDWDGRDPMTISIEELNRLRTPPAISIPYGTYANSPTQPLLIPDSPAWKPFGGQLVLGEMNFPRIFRIWLDQESGMWQGGCVLLIDTPELKGGLHRVTFHGDDLYVGRVHRAWAGGEGLSRIRPTQHQEFEIVSFHPTTRGFRFNFTQPLSADASNPQLWVGERYTYTYHQTYGSPKENREKLDISEVIVAADGLSAEIVVRNYAAGFNYEFTLADLKNRQDRTLLYSNTCYTLNRIPTAP